MRQKTLLEEIGMLDERYGCIDVVEEYVTEAWVVL